MTHYLLAVYLAPGDRAADAAHSPEEAEQKVAAFTQTLADSGQLVYSCDLDDPETAVYTSAGGQLGDGPLHPAADQVDGFWIVDVPTRTQAQALAVRAADACGKSVALRPMRAQ
jgi:hypothetical protein